MPSRGVGKRSDEPRPLSCSARLRIDAPGAAARGAARDAPVTFGDHTLALLLPDYLAANPDVAVRLTLNDRVVHLVDEGYVETCTGEMNRRNSSMARFARLQSSSCQMRGSG